MVRKKTAPAKAKTRVRRRARSLLGKLKPYAIPIGASAAFVPPYMARPEGIVEAIKFDLANFSMSAASTRVQANIGGIAAPIVAGIVVGGTRVLGKHSRLVGDLAVGFGVGTLAKTILDPPAASTAGMVRNGVVGPTLMGLSA